jgi:hypothetical protein
MSDLERIVHMYPAWDRRDKDPAKNYGISSVRIRMVLKGPKGATQFVLSTGWTLPHLPNGEPMGMDVGYHSPKPMYDGQTVMDDNCDILGGPCYYDGSTLQADDMFLLLVRSGSEYVWNELERRYRDFFDRDESAENES